MDLFATNEEIVELEEQLIRSSGICRIEVMTKLAWFQRQCDSNRALELTHEIQQKLAISDFPSQQKKTILARIHLVQCEYHWLFMALPEAESLARGALQEFNRLQDWQGAADAHWLLAWISVDSGNMQQRDIEFVGMIAAARRANDQIRLDVAEAAMARWSAFSAVRKTEEQYSARFEALAKDDNLIRAMWSNEFLGVLMYCKEDLAKALGYTIQAHKQAIKTGQTYFAIVTAVNIADEFSSLNEHLVALDWIQRGLNLARQAGWPRTIGHCLLEMSEIFRQIKNIATAQEMLTEALALLAPINESRAYALALSYQGSLALDQKNYSVALDAFRQLEVRANALQQIDFTVDWQRGQAHALSFLGMPGEALKAAQSSLELTLLQGESAKQIDILMMMADIIFRHPVLAEHDSEPSILSLNYLYQALHIAENIPGYIIPSKLFEMLSLEYSSVKDFEQAFLMASKAIAAKEKALSHETITRATTIQVLHEIERAREDGEYHRQIALSEARRSKELLQITTTLEQLSAIGREITTHLNQTDIFSVLNKCVHVLLDVNVFKIYLIDDDGTHLVMQYCIENAEHLPVSRVNVNDPLANSARCFREGSELLINFSDENDANHIPGTLNTLTGLFFPLNIGEHKLGVMSVESIRRNAFAQRELLIFRSLCAYAAIGFDNSHTYLQLQNTQKQLVYHEKMAALGSIVAGVAHELNTPIGNGLLLASSLHAKSTSMAQKFQENAMRRSELADYLADSEQASDLIFKSFQTAADLVMSFKQVSVDQTTAQRRKFDLKELVDDIVATMRNQFTVSGIRIDQQVKEQLTMDSYPGPLGQVVMNLMQNSLLHAFEGRTNGCLKISATVLATRHIQLEFSDNGHGIAAENLGKIFDPFFTTKLGFGGNGLGLSISYNIVKSILRGEISVTSEMGTGTTFTINIPMDAPAPESKFAS
ncbi:signal transduction histidine kinase/tetratricopeptide (TPR) repeat protein [Oxalobacteraceae bacterium GrIS 2.11]